MKIAPGLLRNPYSPNCCHVKIVQFFSIFYLIQTLSYQFQLCNLAVPPAANQKTPSFRVLEVGGFITPQAVQCILLWELELP
jgi:hypothetical protein